MTTGDTVSGVSCHTSKFMNQAAREKELERMIMALRKQRDFLLTVIAVHLGDEKLAALKKELTLEEAAALVRSSALIHQQTREELERLQEEMKTNKSGANK